MINPTQITATAQVGPIDRPSPHRVTQRRFGLLLGALALVGAWLALAATPALALKAHAFSFSFGTSGSGAAQVSSPRDVAVNDTTGDIYVADTGNDRVDEFDATGNFIRAWGWGVADGASSFETCTTSCQAGSSSSSPGGFEAPTFVAVDNSTGSSAGDVYVGDANDNLVTKFDATGNLISSWGAGGELDGSSATDGPFGPLAGITVDTAGNLWVYDENSNMFEFAPDGSFVTDWNSGRRVDPTGLGIDTDGNMYAVVGAGSLEQWDSSGNDIGEVTDDQTGSQISGVTVDPTTNDIYADDGGSLIRRYSGSSLSACVPNYTCAASETFGSSNLSGSAAGLAINSANGTVYAADPGANDVAVFGFVTLPDVSAASPSNVQNTSVTLNGTVNPDGVAVTSCQFEYGTTTSYGQTVPCSPAPAAIGSGTSPVPVSANITGLQPGTEYHFRLDAGNANGINTGADQPFVSGGVGVASFSSSVTNQDGTPDTQAGSHPYEMTTSIAFNTTTDSQGNTVVVVNPKDLVTNLPAGLVGDSNATPKCTVSELDNSGCPGDSQVGLLEVQEQGEFGPSQLTDPVYNMVAPAGMPAQFGSKVVAPDVFVDVSVRTGGDYGLTATVDNITSLLSLSGTTLTLWGVPADPSHDAQRVCSGNVSPCSSGAPLTPLLTMPTSCSGTLATTVETDSWQTPGEFVSASSSSPAMTGCDRLSFPTPPSISAQPSSSVADSPSGLGVDVHVPQAPDDPNALASPTVKNAVVTLPAGMSVNPSAADGLNACSPAEIGLDNANEPSCPDASKVGTVEIDTPLLSDPLTGSIYLAQQNSNPFDSLLAVYVTAEADGVLVKLAGQVAADPVTGQLTTTFSNNPQLPFSDFKLNFFGGPRAVLATPDSCGTFTTTSDLTPWSSPDTPDATPSDSFAIDSGCVSGFSPSFTAGTQSPQAGAFTPFVMSFSRPDTSQDMQGLTVQLPPGVLAKLAGVGLCTDAQLAQAASKTGTDEQSSPSCPADSQVGTVQTGAGPGPDPVFLPGKAYLTGPYKGAPYGLAEIVPAVAGPYDLGTVVVRQALHIDPTTAQVTAVSDPLPTILKGIPLRLRRVDVNLNRPDFIVNPTSCNVMSVTGTLSSTLGISAPVSSRFQVGGCAALPFSPKLHMKLTGKGQTRSGRHPNLIATVSQKTGQANIQAVKVALPLSLALDPNNSNNVCPYATAQAVHGGAVGCPASTIVGQATAITPLLSQPLTGPVYLVQGLSINNGVQTHTLPTLLIPLRGQIALDLRAQTSVSHGKLVTTFPAIPDAAVSKFTLQINGGKKGILVITGRGRTICGSPQISQTTLTGQNGKAIYPNIKMTTPCRAAHHKKKLKKHH